jgi:hypothetical protein
MKTLIATIAKIFLISWALGMLQKIYDKQDEIIKELKSK